MSGPKIESVVREINALPANWHGCGSMASEVIHAIAEHMTSLGDIRRTVETGSGKTTVLFSHLSPHHTVFALDHARSVSCVRESPLCRMEAVHVVDGPTQLTLPRYEFAEPLQVALIDGPHGYPFPDLEYYYLYPQIAPGGLLLIDDTNIPSIGRMRDIIAADEMFEQIDVVADTAFLRRTTAPLFDPLGDGWWLQAFNKSYYDQLTNPQPRSKPARTASAARRLISKIVPANIARRIPKSIKRLLPD